jgi:hypothetical protein
VKIEFAALAMLRLNFLQLLFEKNNLAQLGTPISSKDLTKLPGSFSKPSPMDLNKSIIKFIKSINTGSINCMKNSTAVVFIQFMIESKNAVNFTLKSDKKVLSLSNIPLKKLVICSDNVFDRFDKKFKTTSR